jgi:hypothetical protein
MAAASRGSIIAEADPAAGLAISAIRRSFHPVVTACLAVPRCRPAFVEDLAAVAASFRQAHQRMLEVQGAGLVTALPGTVPLTRHERRLLRATAAAQAEDDELMDAYLYTLAPGQEVRPHLACAVIVLATKLAIAGHWFPNPGAGTPLT